MEASRNYWDREINKKLRRRSQVERLLIMQVANLEDTEKDLLAEVEKEIEKLKYYLEESDEMIEEGDFVEIEVTHNRTTAIHDKLCNLIAQVQELKVERGIETTRAICQWKKDMKERYAPSTL